MDAGRMPRPGPGRDLCRRRRRSWGGGMKSSAMREMMALTEQPDVISLAGGLPDTSTFAPELYAKLMAEVADSTARALQYGPTEGMAATVHCIVEVMAAEGTAIDPSE